MLLWKLFVVLTRNYPHIARWIDEAWIAFVWTITFTVVGLDEQDLTLAETNTILVD